MKKFLFAAAAFAALPATQASAVTTVTITNWSVGANLIGSVAVTSPAISEPPIYVNQFLFQGYKNGDVNQVFSELTNCVDLQNYVATGSNYTLPSFSQRVPDPVLRGQLLAFIGHTTGLVAGANGTAKNVAAAAMQMGIWEILYEGGASYDVTSGNFRSIDIGWSGANFAAAQTQANQWLGLTTSHAWQPVAGTTLGYLYAPDKQSQVYLRSLEQGETGFSVAGVPEPATWAMMISGFGLAGLAMRRRRRSGTFATASA